MYSMKLKPETRRYIARCIVNKSGPKVVDFLLDTGAKYTCCSYLSVNPKIREADCQMFDSKKLGGMVAGTTLRVYRYHVGQFTIGTVDMGEQDIWITFDERATDDVLGMDILQQVYMYQDRDMLEMRVALDKRESLLMSD